MHLEHEEIALFFQIQNHQSVNHLYLQLETEAAIQRSLDILKKDRTVIVIAHRLSTVRNADIIYVLENGSVVESGNHESLLDMEGVYSKLWSVQTGEKI